MSSKNKRFLFEGIFPTTSEQQIYHRGRVKITSPEQFVPLLLANYGENGYTEGADALFKRNSTSDWMYVHNSVRKLAKPLLENYTNREGFKEVMFPELKRILSTKLPTEYTIFDPRGNQSGNYGWGYQNSDQIFSSFTTSSIMAISQDYKSMVGLGFMADVQVPSIISKQTILYQSKEYQLPQHTITPQVLVVLKYKHLLKARASLFLRVPMDIAFGDIKLIRVQSFRNSRINEWYNWNIQHSISESGMQIDYATEADMEKYLFAPKMKKTRAAYLDDARKVVEQGPAPHVIF